METKKFNLRNVILLVVVIAVALLIFKKCFERNNPKVADLPTINEVKELKELKTKTGKSVYQLQHIPTKKIIYSGISKTKYDSILNELEIKEKQVKALTIFTGKIQDSLKLSKLERDELNNKVWKWEKTLASGTKIVRVMSEKDSVLHESSDIKVAFVDKTEGRGKNTKFFTEFFPIDNNIKFNGASVFRKENKEIRDILQVDLNGEFQKSFISPNARFISDVQLSFFPDGKFVPSAKIGGQYDVQNGLDWFWGVRLKFNLFRIKNQ